MSGAILNLIYGIAIDIGDMYPPDEYENPADQYDDGSDAVEEEKQVLRDHEDAHGFISTYDAHGDSENPVAFGIKLIAYSEGNSISVDKLKRLLTVTDEMEAEFKDLWESLDDEVRALLTKYFDVQPVVFFHWSSS